MRPGRLTIKSCSSTAACISSSQGPSNAHYMLCCGAASILTYCNESLSTQSVPGLPPCLSVKTTWMKKLSLDIRRASLWQVARISPVLARSSRNDHARAGRVDNATRARSAGCQYRVGIILSASYGRRSIILKRAPACENAAAFENAPNCSITLRIVRERARSERRARSPDGIPEIASFQNAGGDPERHGFSERRWRL